MVTRAMAPFTASPQQSSDQLGVKTQMKITDSSWGSHDSQTGSMAQVAPLHNPSISKLHSDPVESSSVATGNRDGTTIQKEKTFGKRVFGVTTIVYSGKLWKNHKTIRHGLRKPDFRSGSRLRVGKVLAPYNACPKAETTASSQAKLRRHTSATEPTATVPAATSRRPGRRLVTPIAATVSAGHRIKLSHFSFSSREVIFSSPTLGPLVTTPVTTRDSPRALLHFGHNNPAPAQGTVARPRSFKLGPPPATTVTIGGITSVNASCRSLSSSFTFLLRFSTFLCTFNSTSLVAGDAAGDYQKQPSFTILLIVR
ncbi:hypothetical protein V8G54_011092 [Vigna mungo]|uniref:Uncharacterized protein n=1 Tax=Vigna mungo TaxID=3915 RepID=A0AAQ3NNZ7_VIGMU